MVSGGRAVFKYVLEIKDMLTKGRQVVQMNNQITGSTQKASVATDKYSSSVQGAGRSSAAAAVNFQTMTQGMLNLSTAGIQTFTSISNLDRAGNRLAMSQIAVARAQDLLNNKQLRLNELMEKGGAGTQKATNLTNELATARADLLVKTDKLKIEEGALFDIQLLFIANIANVMISSIQTITTLRTLDIAATIKQTISQKLHNAGILTTTRTYPLLNAAINQNTVVTNTAINANRLLTLSIPVVGVALVGVTLAWQAYTENIGGFADAVNKMLPFMKDQKALLGDVQDELNGTNAEADKLNDTLNEQVEVMFKLPLNYKLSSDALDRLRMTYSATTKQAQEFNKEVARNPQVFKQATVNGGFIREGEILKDGGIGTSNVIRAEGDGIHTAKAIHSSSISYPSFNDIRRAATVGAVAPLNPALVSSPQAPLVANFNNDIFRKGSPFDLLNFANPQTQAAAGGRAAINNFADVARKAGNVLTNLAVGANYYFYQNNIDLRVPETAMEFIQNGIRNITNFEASTDLITGTTADFRNRIQPQRDLIKSQIGDNFNPRTLQSLLNKANDPNRSKGSFVGGGAFTAGVSEINGLAPGFFGGIEQLRLIKVQLQDKQKAFANLDPTNIAAYQQAILDISVLSDIVNVFETDPDRIAGLTKQQIINSNTIIDIAFTPEQQLKSMEDARERIRKQRLKGLTDLVNKELRTVEANRLINRAISLGLDLDDSQFRHNLNQVFRDTLFKEQGTDLIGPRAINLAGIKDALVRGIGKKRGDEGEFINIPDEVLIALAIKKTQTRLGSTNFLLPRDTAHDRLVAAAFGATHIDSGGRRGQFNFGQIGGQLGGTLGGLILNKDDPLLRSSAGMGPIQGQVFRETGVNIGGVAESIGFGQSKELAKVQGLMEQFKNTAGGNADSAISILNHISANNAFGQRADLNDLLSGKHSYADIAAGRIMNGNANGTGIGRTDFFGTGFFNSTGASGAAQVAPGSIKVPAWVAQQRAISLNNQRRLRYGGTQVYDDNGRALATTVQGSVRGGFDSLAEYRANVREDFRQASNGASASLQLSFGITTTGLFGGALQRQRSINTLQAYSSSIVSAGLQLSILSSPGRMGQSFDYAGYRAVRRPSIQEANRATLARAGQINLLMGGFGLPEFFGSAQSGADLAIEIAAQDAKINSIGLNRTEAFRIIDTQGRGRAEIDDRVLWTQRNSSISTGVAVI